MTRTELFRAAAASTIGKFSVGTYQYLDATETYDTNTGLVSRVVTTTNVPAARYSIRADKRAQMSYSEDTCIVAIAGTDLAAVVPEVGGIVIFPDATRHRVVYVEFDQYSAAYFLHVAVTPDGS